MSRNSTNKRDVTLEGLRNEGTGPASAPHGADATPGFEVESRWKEQVIYWEGPTGFIFDAGWGVEPPVLYVPSTEDWDRATADWMVGRREEIVTRLTEQSGHRLEVGHYDSASTGRRTER